MTVSFRLMLLAAAFAGAPLTGAAQTNPNLPRFDRALLLETSSETSANVSIGDLNGDGLPDLVLAKGRHWPLVDRVLFGNGRGGFDGGHDLGTASDRTYSGLLVDVDRDGDLDVVISNDNPDPGLIYLNDGSGRFSVGSSFGAAEWNTRNATVADLNGDGLPDIIVANRSGPNPGGNYICLNQGGGRFGSDCLRFSRESATTITATDLNGDGRIDLVVPHRDGGQGQLYLHNADASSLEFTQVPFGPLRFALSEGNLVPYALVIGDLNLDGAVDIVVGYIEAPSAVYFNAGTGRRFTPVLFGDGAGSVYGFAIGDLDGDGRPDIAAARSEAPNMVYFADPPVGGKR